MVAKQTKKTIANVRRMNIAVPEELAIAIEVRCAQKRLRLSDAAKEAFAKWVVSKR